MNCMQHGMADKMEWEVFNGVIDSVTFGEFICFTITTNDCMASSFLDSHHVMGFFNLKYHSGDEESIGVVML